MSQYFFAEQPYAPPSGPGWQVYNKDLLALSSVQPAQWSTDSYTMTHYDSVIVMALAATAAKRPARPYGIRSSRRSPRPPRGGGGAYVRGRRRGAPGGKKIDYVGAAGVIDFNQWHNSGGGFEIGAY